MVLIANTRTTLRERYKRTVEFADWQYGDRLAPPVCPQKAFVLRFFNPHQVNFSCTVS